MNAMPLSAKDKMLRSIERYAEASEEWARALVNGVGLDTAMREQMKRRQVVMDRLDRIFWLVGQ